MHAGYDGYKKILHTPLKLYFDHYSFQDPSIEIERLAEFLGVTCSTDLSVVDKTTFTKMAAAVNQSFRDQHIFESESKDGTNFYLLKGTVSFNIVILSQHR